MGRPKIELPQGVSEEAFRTLTLKVKAANERLRSAKPGQKEALEYFTKGENFSRAKPKSAAEFKQRMQEVERFLGAETSSKVGWENVKRRSVESAGKTLREKLHYDLIDEELANILREVDKKSQKQYYRILDIIQAKKYDAEAKGRVFDDAEMEKAIAQAVRSHMSAGEAIRFKTRAAGRRERAAERLRK